MHSKPGEVARQWGSEVVVTTAPSHHPTTSQPRRGFSLMELQVALVVFGIGLGGLCPLVVMQSRQLKNYQSRLDPRTAYYLVPSADIWARKLGASASLLTQVPAGQLAASS